MKENLGFVLEIEKDLQKLSLAGDVLKQVLDELTQSTQYLFNLIRTSKSRIDEYKF